MSLRDRLFRPQHDPSIPILGDSAELAGSEEWFDARETEARDTAEQVRETEKHALGQLDNKPYPVLVHDYLRPALGAAISARRKSRAGISPATMDDDRRAYTRLLIVLSEVEDCAERTDPPVAREIAPEERGDVSVRLLSLCAHDDEFEMPEHELVQAIAIANLGYTPDEANELTMKVEHIGPQTIADGLTVTSAALIKQLFESIGLSVELKEDHRTARASGGQRQPIPQHVRHEVWRRDGGQCVDCGSRERLEFDHIVPLSRGGSNTARNIELRCENCNRAKSDRI